MKNNTLYKKHKVHKTRDKKHKVHKTRNKKHKPHKTQGRKHKPRKTQYRSAVNRKHRRTQIGKGRWWFKSRDRAINIPPLINPPTLGNPPIAQPQVAPSSYVYYDPATIAEQQRLLDMFKHENDIRQMFNVNLQEEKRQLDNFARQKQQRQEARFIPPRISPRNLYVGEQYDPIWGNWGQGN
jgi:hypothetical protein